MPPWALCSGGLGWGWIVCMSPQCPDAAAPGPKAHFENHQVRETECPCGGGWHMRRHVVGIKGREASGGWITSSFVKRPNRCGVSSKGSLKCLERFSVGNGPDF